MWISDIVDTKYHRCYTYIIKRNLPLPQESVYNIEAIAENLGDAIGGGVGIWGRIIKEKGKNMYLSEKIRNLFTDKARFEKAYRVFQNRKGSVELAKTDTDRMIGYYQIMSHYDKEIARAISDEETSKVII